MVIATRTPRTLPCWAAGPRCSRSLVRLHRIAAYGLVIALLLHLGGCASAPAAVSVTPSATTDVEVEVATTPITATATLLTPVIEATVAAAATEVAEVATTTTVTPTTEVAPTPIMVEFATYTGTQNLSVLSKPDNTFPATLRITVLRAGEEIKIEGKTNLDGTTWIQFTTKDGKTGYVPFYDFFEVTKREDGASVVAKTPEAVTNPTTPTAETKGVTNLRTGPGTGYDVASSLPANTKIEIIGKSPDGSWLKVKANGQEVWISAGLVTQTGPTEKIAIVAVPISAMSH